ncbi:hypothetical protein AtEden1_Chr4g0278531 [Arabidopsis thaliana]
MFSYVIHLRIMFSYVTLLNQVVVDYFLAQIYKQVHRPLPRLQHFQEMVL